MLDGSWGNWRLCRSDLPFDFAHRPDLAEVKKGERLRERQKRLVTHKLSNVQPEV